MAFKLTKKERAEYEVHTADLSEAAAKLYRAVDEYNAAVAEARDALEAPLAAYNAALEVAGAFVAGIHEASQEAYDDKSERWQESEAGQNAYAWLESWESIDFDPVELDEPVELEEPDLRHSDEMDALPTSFRDDEEVGG
jgi:hypothetical protein